MEETVLADFDAEIGRLCLSRAGRDQGKHFIVKEVIDESYVYIVDGMMHKVAAPKKKKLKHLDMKPIVLEGIAAKLQDGTKVFDAEIASAIIGSTTK